MKRDLGLPMELEKKMDLEKKTALAKTMALGWEGSKKKVGWKPKAEKSRRDVCSENHWVQTKTNRQQTEFYFLVDLEWSIGHSMALYCC